MKIFDFDKKCGECVQVSHLHAVAKQYKVQLMLNYSLLLFIGGSRRTFSWGWSDRLYKCCSIYEGLKWLVLTIPFIF